MAASGFYEGFSLSHAALLDGSAGSGGSGTEAGNIYGVRNGTLATDSGNFENTGDDIVQSEWFWFNFANVTIEAGFIPYSTLATLTGTTVYSSGTGTNDYYAIPLWTWSSMNQPTRPMQIRVPSKDSNGLVRTLDFVLYKVQFMPFNFTGPSYKNGLTCSIAGRALLSTVDEKGATLPTSFPRSIGRIVNAPGTLTGAFAPNSTFGVTSSL